jgi:hypothetical protein
MVLDWRFIFHVFRCLQIGPINQKLHLYLVLSLADAAPFKPAPPPPCTGNIYPPPCWRPSPVSTRRRPSPSPCLRAPTSSTLSVSTPPSSTPSRAGKLRSPPCIGDPHARTTPASVRVNELCPLHTSETRRHQFQPKPFYQVRIEGCLFCIMRIPFGIGSLIPKSKSKTSKHVVLKIYNNYNCSIPCWVPTFKRGIKKASGPLTCYTTYQQFSTVADNAM